MHIKNLTLVWEARVFPTIHPQQALREKSKECYHNSHPIKQNFKPHCLKEPRLGDIKQIQNKLN
jgi:hypothetical protein